MNPTLVACLVFSFLGYSNPINAASIPLDVKSIPSNAASIPSVSNPSNGRIVGGSVVDISSYPYTVGLLLHSSHICGGSIISQTWILTAAHCITQSSVSPYTIRAGSSSRSSGGVTRAAQNIYVHARYSASTTDNDIALIRLQSALTYGNTIRATSLASANANIPSGTNAIVTGWGLTTEGGSTSAQLRAVTVPVVTNAVCRTNYGSRITNNMLCAGFSAGGRDACGGDSGGPLVASSYGQIGIVSWGNGCARPGFYGVYASVPVLRTWINSIVNG